MPTTPVKPPNPKANDQEEAPPLELIGVSDQRSAFDRRTLAQTPVIETRRGGDRRGAGKTGASGALRGYGGQSTHRAAAAPARSAGAAAARDTILKTWIGIVAIVALTALVGFAVLSWRSQTDPHFVKAQKIVRDYELGKDPQTLNYDDPSYQEALAELGMVEAKSPSFPDAQKLSAHISGKIAGFRQALKVRQVKMEATAAADDARDEAILRTMRLTTGTDPDAATRVQIRGKTECQDEEAHAKGGHKH